MTRETEALASLRRRLDDLIAAVEELPQKDAAGRADLERLLESLGPAAALVADGDGRYVLVNSAACALTGYSTRELLDLSVWDLTPDAKEHEAERLWRAFLDRRDQIGEYPVLTKSGAIVAAVYAARTNLIPGLHVSLLQRVPGAEHE